MLMTRMFRKMYARGIVTFSSGKLKCKRRNVNGAINTEKKNRKNAMEKNKGIFQARLSLNPCCPTLKLRPMKTTCRWKKH
ncbi:hypothetical protein Q1695_011848 [Nippostrongylus brasiliensis]|nr:hypothetical protein Q1695_011848 [Nippostrongylus brasiliensis]